MSAATLLGIAIGAIIVLLFLVIQVKMSAFVAILLVATGTALATGIPVEEIVPVLQQGMGNTLGSVMIVVGLGAMLGRVIEVAGGADALAHSFTRVLAKSVSARPSRRQRSCLEFRSSSMWASLSLRRSSSALRGLPTSIH